MGKVSKDRETPERVEEEPELVLSRKLVNAIVEEAVGAVASEYRRVIEAAVKMAIDQYKQERQERIYRIKDKRYQNTRMLFKKWRELQDYYHNTIYDSAEVAKSYGADLMQMVGCSYEQRIVNSVRDKVAFTSVVMENFEVQFDLYKEFCRRSGKPELIRRWNVLYDTYLNMKKVMTPQEVADKYGISISQAYIDLEKAARDMDKRLFGLDPEFFDFE